MQKLLRFVLLGILLVCGKIFAADTIYILEIKGPITPPIEAYVENGIKAAVDEKARLIILKLDTPGGLESTMRGINQSILASPIPIATFVSPEGARATSAGTFMLYASPIAAMTPGTHLGAASPINVGGNSDKNLSTYEKKAKSDAIAYIQSLANLHKRNAEWAKSAVADAVSIDANTALQKNVIDVIAVNVPDLIDKIQGRKIVVQNKSIQLELLNPIFKEYQPDWRIQFLSIITNPSIAYILMLAGLYGLFFELMNPGLILPGVVGIIALLIALYAFQLLPVSYTGLTLLLLGIAGMLAEAVMTTFGILGIGGIIAFITGSIMLFDSSIPGVQLAWQVILIMSLLTILFVFLIVWLAAKAMKKPIVAGREALINMTGEVVDNAQDALIVRVNGELWQAHCDESLTKQQSIKVIGVENLTLTVKPLRE